MLLYSCRKAHSRLTENSPGIGVLSDLPVVHPRAPIGRTEMIGTTLKMASPGFRSLAITCAAAYQVVQRQTFCNLRTQKSQAGGLPQAGDLPGLHSKTLSPKQKNKFTAEGTSTRRLRAEQDRHILIHLPPKQCISDVPGYLAPRPCGAGSHMTYDP